MGLLSDIFSKAPVVFADELVVKIARQFPPASEAQLGKKGAQRRLEGVIEPVMQDIDIFQQKNRLGWIGKARFGNAVRWRLIEKGYSKGFSEAITEGVIRQITVQS
ncbi:hypothetical protein VVD49_18160 [Uliginosibacterium sp. H3]|uniref:Uncharacterized protein n=1 Tax=Uliginosibacterium silvisoli TaxID=3114758 RepID=A0ABU6K708_9RHOO|nr:hypothetical protein [Uliginosibacterium sp. H3]